MARTGLGARARPTGLRSGASDDLGSGTTSRPGLGGGDDEGYKMGDKVEARYKGGAKWHSGRIANVNRDGTYDVRYDDGDEERRVESRMIRKLGGGRDPFASSGRAMDSDADESYRMGDKVEARFKGGTKWHPGRIANVNRDGTYDVRYDDGDEERRVESRMIRKLSRTPRERGAPEPDHEHSPEPMRGLSG